MQKCMQHKKFPLFSGFFIGGASYHDTIQQVFTGGMRGSNSAMATAFLAEHQQLMAMFPHLPPNPRASEQVRKCGTQQNAPSLSVFIIKSIVIGVTQRRFFKLGMALCLSRGMRPTPWLQLLYSQALLLSS